MDPLQRQAMTLFISFAAVVYAAALFYSYLSGNIFACKLILGAVLGLSIFIILLFRERPEKQINEREQEGSGR